MYTFQAFPAVLLTLVPMTETVLKIYNTDDIGTMCIEVKQQQLEVQLPVHVRLQPEHPQSSANQ